MFSSWLWRSRAYLAELVPTLTPPGETSRWFGLRTDIVHVRVIGKGRDTTLCFGPYVQSCLHWEIWCFSSRPKVQPSLCPSPWSSRETFTASRWGHHTHAPLHLIERLSRLKWFYVSELRPPGDGALCRLFRLSTPSWEFAFLLAFR